MNESQNDKYSILINDKVANVYTLTASMTSLIEKLMKQFLSHFHDNNRNK